MNELDFQQKYDKQIREIEQVFGLSIQRILGEIDALDLLSINNGDVDKTIREINRILEVSIKDLDEKTDELIPAVVEAGVLLYLASLSITVGELTLNHLQKGLIKRLTREMKNDFRTIIRTMSTKTDAALREAVNASLRRRFLGSPLDLPELQKQRQRIAEAVKQSVKSGFVDKVGRTWQPETYARVVAQTKVMTALNEAAINEGIARGNKFGIIAGPTAKDACNDWIGRIVKLDESIPGNYPTYESIKATKECFHPNCHHYIRGISEKDIEN
jgi:hypothetical protein